MPTLTKAQSKVDTRMASITMPCRDLLKALRKVAPCMPRGEACYNMCGVLFEFDRDATRIVATDGHRLAAFVLAPEARNVQPLRATVSRKGVKALIKALTAQRGECTIAATYSNKATAALHIAGKVFPLECIDDAFPDWRRVVPRYPEGAMSGDAKDVLAGIKSFRAAPDAKSGDVALRVRRGSLAANFETPIYEEFDHRISRGRWRGTVVKRTRIKEYKATHWTIPATIGSDDTDCEFGINARYFEDAIKATVVKGKVYMRNVNGSGGPILFTADGSTLTYIVLPKRV